MSPVNELLDLLKNLFLTYLAFCRKSASTVTFDKNDPSPNLKGITTIQHKKYTTLTGEFKEWRRILTCQAFYQVLKTTFILIYQMCKFASLNLNKSIDKQPWLNWNCLSLWVKFKRYIFKT